MQHGPGPPCREQDPAERIDALGRDAIAEIVSLARPVPNICRVPHHSDNYPAKPLEGYDLAQLACQTTVFLKGESRPPPKAAPGSQDANTLAAFFAAWRAGRVAKRSDLPDVSGDTTPPDADVWQTDQGSEVRGRDVRTCGSPHVSSGADLMDDVGWYNDRIGAILASEVRRRRLKADRIHGPFLLWMAEIWRRRELAARRDCKTSSRYLA